MTEQACATPAADLRESKRKCWWSDCDRTAWFRDWAGWCWCPRHLYRTWRYGGADLRNRVRQLRWLKVRWPYGG